jgi:four helix bundle protein
MELTALRRSKLLNPGTREPENRAVAEKPRYTFKNLELWKAAQDFGVEIALLVDGLPSKRPADAAGRQLIRAATSIAANIAEGHGRFTFGAYRNHLSIAKGSASECQSWLDFLARLGFVDEAASQKLESRCFSLIGGLTRRITALEERERLPRTREDPAIYEADPVPGFERSMVPEPGLEDGE